MSVPIYAAYSPTPDALSSVHNYQPLTYPVVFTPTTTVDSQFPLSNPSSSPDTANTSVSQILVLCLANRRRRQTSKPSPGNHSHK
jgi:hypothetical protein